MKINSQCHCCADADGACTLIHSLYVQCSSVSQEHMKKRLMKWYSRVWCVLLKQCLRAQQVAYGPDGNPSKALLGFCKKNVVSVASVTREADAKGTEYVWAVVKQPGRAASQVSNLLLKS